MPLSPTTRIGPYEIVAPLGAGGMGEVYRARDLHLDRTVAVKALPDGFAHDPERLARFEREAKLLASLNHPNIAGIYGVVESDDRRYLALEFVDGTTLAERLGRGALPLDESLEICSQIAAALEAAHEAGVVHRDLKPGNVMLKPDGSVKVLDFGLARGGASQGSDSNPNLSASPTMTYAATQAGMILGTAAYMSPEQARGRIVDRRTDIWSFGCVLYECLTGRQLFTGETVSDMIAKILEREPDWSAIPARAPGRVRELLARCLEKDAKKRLRDIGDARLWLDESIAELRSGTKDSKAAERAQRRMGRAAPAWIAAAFALGLIAGGTLWAVLRPGGGGRGAGPGRAARLSVAMPATLRVQAALLTPDGKAIVALANDRATPPGQRPITRLYLRQLDRSDFEPVRGTEGIQGFRYIQGGKWIAFVGPTTAQSSDLQIQKMPLDGSAPPVAMTAWKPGWSSFVVLESGDILVAEAQSARYARLRPNGESIGDSKPFVSDSAGYSFTIERVLPGDRGVLLSAARWGSAGYEINVAVMDLKSGATKVLIQNGGHPRYLPAGYLVFSRKDVMMAVPMDLGRLEVRGQPVALMDGLRTISTWAPGDFELSGGGLLGFPPGGRSGGRRSVAIADAAGKITTWAGEPQAYELPPALTRDGRRFACVIANSRGVYEIWGSELDRPALRPLVTMENADCQYPAWSPDGRRIAFYRDAHDDRDGVYVTDVDGGGAPKLVLPRGMIGRLDSPTSWSPDGLRLIVERLDHGRRSLAVVRLDLPPDPSRAPVVLESGGANLDFGQYSPDGRWITYTSDRTGAPAVYVASLSPDGALGQALQVSGPDGDFPRWSSDGHALYYLDPRSGLIKIPIQMSPVPSAGKPEVVHDADLQASYARRYWPLPNGSIFMIRRGEDEGEIQRLDLVFDFLDVVKEKTRASGRGK
jgi:eukaryotic-like serine/threonine-protein kinase